MMSADLEAHWRMTDLESRLRSLGQSMHIPGASVATIEGRAVESVIAYGVRDARSSAPVDDETIFEAASLSKPIVAYAGLQLVDAGRLGLDDPLPSLPALSGTDDHAVGHITVRQVLSHTTGLPNWRRKGVPLRTYFPPGSRFSYSGEGFVHLQSVIERIEGEPLDDVIRRLVFHPLGMSRSSFVWQERFEENFASPHDGDGRPGERFRPIAANAAYSLQTTAADYARFVLAVMSGSGLKETTRDHWVTPHVHPPKGRFEALEVNAPPTEPDVAWGLGWGLEPDDGAFFHWGANSGATAFVIGALKERRAIVIFSNSDSGLQMAADLVTQVLPGKHASLGWLGLTE